MNLLGTKSNHLYVTSRRIGRGGEGSALAVEGDNTRLVKVSDVPPTPAVVRKLTLLSRWNPKPAHTALPIETVIDLATKKVIGFVQQFFSRTVPLAAILDSHGRKTHGFPDDLAFCVRVCRLLAESLLRIHASNLVFGDVTPGNFLLGWDLFGRVSVVYAIDCGTLQVIIRTNHGNEIYPSGVATEEWAAPEIQRTDWATSLRSVFSDSFGFALVCWKLLFGGSHAFAVVTPRNVDVPPIGERIERHLFSAAPATPLPSGWSAPATTPSLAVLPTDIRDMFFRTFTVDDPRDRPVMDEWLRAFRTWEALLLPSLPLRILGIWNRSLANRLAVLLATGKPWAGRATVVAAIMLLTVFGFGTGETPREFRGRDGESHPERLRSEEAGYRPVQPRFIDPDLFPELLETVPKLKPE